MLGGAGAGSVTIDPTFAPVVEPGNIVRYHVLGALGAGDLNVTFNRGTWNLLSTSDGSTSQDNGGVAGTTLVDLGTVTAGDGAELHRQKARRSM